MYLCPQKTSPETKMQKTQIRKPCFYFHFLASTTCAKIDKKHNNQKRKKNTPIAYLRFLHFQKKHTQEHPLTVCTTQQQPASNLQASKQSRSERKNTHSQCVFLLSDAKVHDQRE